MYSSRERITRTHAHTYIRVLYYVSSLCVCISYKYTHILYTLEDVCGSRRMHALYYYYKSRIDLRVRSGYQFREKCFVASCTKTPNGGGGTVKSGTCVFGPVRSFCRNNNNCSVSCFLLGCIFLAIRFTRLRFYSLLRPYVLQKHSK